MTTDIKSFTKPQEIVEAGERIYNERFKKDLEAQNSGQFAAIDVLGARVYVAQFPEEALEKARKEAPTGLFHLIKIGSTGAFRVSYASNARSNWIF